MQTTKFNYRMLASTFKLLREKHGYTKVYVAESINLSDTAVANHEFGRTIPDFYTIIAYCNLYKITLPEFFHYVQYLNDTDTPPVISSDIRRDAVKLMIKGN